MTLKVLLFGASVAACAAKPEAPPCDPATANQLVAEALLAGEKCASAGVPYEDCVGLAAVNRRKQERHELCRARIEAD